MFVAYLIRASDQVSFFLYIFILYFFLQKPCLLFPVFPKLKSEYRHHHPSLEMNPDAERTRQWEELKEEIRYLYVDKDMSMKDVMAKMISRYNFIATKSQYETQLKRKWGFRKYLTAKNEDLGLVARQFAIAQRQSGGIRKAEFKFRHKNLSRPLTARLLRRKGALPALLEINPGINDRGEWDSTTLYCIGVPSLLTL